MRLFAIITFTLLLPITVLIYLVIFFKSGNSVIFTQIRIGKNKMPFTILKFRTIKNNNITPEGKIIRKLGLDELPQIVNIIKGEMSFIGPRPLTEFDINRLGWNLDQYNERWSVKPGITGRAQLSTVCSADLSMKNDLFYVKHKSFVLDTKIFIKSLVIPFIGKLTK